jgi:hypothetical protein
MLRHPRSRRSTVRLVRRRPWFVALSMFASLLLLSDVAVAATKVLATSRNEFDGTAEDGYFAYTQSRAGHPRRFDVYLKPPGAPRIKVNAAGAKGFYPNLEMGDLTYGDRLVFAQRSSRNTNIKIWDVDEGVRGNPPAGINTTKVESKPSLSGQHLLFGRGPADGGGYMTRIVLYDFSTGLSDVIDTAPTNGIVYPGTVNGDWATWTECSPSDCRAWRYQISTADKTEVPSGARLIYSSAIGEDGTVWFVQSGIGCGKNVKIRRQEVGADPTTLVDFSSGIDALISDLDDSGATRRLYFSRVNCSKRNWNIYRVAGD